jgi:hypothetical protein
MSFFSFVDRIDPNISHYMTTEYISIANGLLHTHTLTPVIQQNTNLRHPQMIDTCCSPCESYFSSSQPNPHCLPSSHANTSLHSDRCCLETPTSPSSTLYTPLNTLSSLRLSLTRYVLLYIEKSACVTPTTPTPSDTLKPHSVIPLHSDPFAHSDPCERIVGQRARCCAQKLPRASSTPLCMRRIATRGSVLTI